MTQQDPLELQSWPEPFSGRPSVLLDVAQSIRDQAVEAARQEGEQLAQAWADLVQLYGVRLMIDQATTMGLWPEQSAGPVPEEETQPTKCAACFGKGLTNQDARPGITLPAEDCRACNGSGASPVPTLERQPNE